jgi:hypothetical protein
MSIELQMDILDAFTNYPEEYMSLNAISKRIERAYPQVHSQAKKMIEDNLLKSMVIGKAIACTPNLKNPLAILLLGLSHAKKAESVYKENTELHEFIIKILSAIGNESSSIILHEKEMIILTDLEQKKIIENYSNELLKNIPKIAKSVKKVTCIPYGSINNLKTKEKDFIVLYGYESFFLKWGDKHE